MRTIWKFAFAVSGIVEIEMPIGSMILHAAMQDASMCIWAEVFAGAATELRRFRVFGIGHSIPSVELAHVATVLDRQFVWHLFEEKKP